MSNNHKSSDFKRYMVLFCIVIALYILTSVLDHHNTYYENRYKSSATVTGKYNKVESRDLIFGREYHYLQITYGEHDYRGLVLVTRYLYNNINIGDIIYIKVYEKYRKLDDSNVECIVTFDHT